MVREKAKFGDHMYCLCSQKFFFNFSKILKIYYYFKNLKKFKKKIKIEIVFKKKSKIALISEMVR